MNLKSKLVFLILVLLLCAGCSTGPSAVIEGAAVNGPIHKTGPGEFMEFTIPVKQAGDPIGIVYHGMINQGILRAQLLDPDGKTVWGYDAQPGTFSENCLFTALPAGNYTFGLTWDGPVEGQYWLEWEPHAIPSQTLSPIVLLGGFGMMAVGIAAVIYAARRRLGWSYLGLGALAWTLTVALKFAWAIPLNTPIAAALSAVLPPLPAAWLTYLYVGSLTGIFEVLVLWPALRYTRLGRAPWPRALSFGIGFGAVEAFLVGCAAALPAITALAAPQFLSPAALQNLLIYQDPLHSLASIAERILIIVVHIFSNVLLFYAIARREPRWLWISALYKTLVDTLAAYASMNGTAASVGGHWLIEMGILIFALVGWKGIQWIQAHYPAEPEPATPEITA